MNGHGKAPAIRQKAVHLLTENEAVSNSVSPKLRINPVLVTVALNMMSNYIPSPLGLFVPKGVLVHLPCQKGKSFLHLRIHAGSSLCEKESKNSLATHIIAIKAFCTPLPVKGTRNNMPNGK